ncbi:fimbria/pilus outer membrane usher protein [Ramlibacter sp.]|uniref:fimbria/pilus outer membrane usher protein n=1 Tax=Ramlibacter sp. TaxID=1917967 RepID=UPI00181A86B1|nr:fimbrial biogenesis outer membrane usher protein [Ramlibacter sp.]
MLSPAWSAQPPLDVSLVPQPNSAVQVQLRGNTSEPVLMWSGTSQAPPYRVALLWEASQVALGHPLPQVPAGGSGPLQTMTMSDTPQGTRLEMQVDQDVLPRLRRVADSWVLQLDAVAPKAPRAPAPARVAAPVAAPVATAPTPVRPSAAPAPLQVALAAVQPPVQPPAAPAPARELLALARPSALPPPSPPPGRRPETLLLDVQVNGSVLPDVVRVERLADGRVILPAATWKTARLRPAGDTVVFSDSDGAGYALDAATGLHYRIDRSKLQLVIDAQPEAFDGTRISMSGTERDLPNKASPGVYLNYDVTMTAGEGSSSRGGLVEMVAFNHLGALVSGSALTSSSSDGLRHVRTETYARKDWPGTMESLVVGDAIGSAGAWSRPVRFGGVRYARDFSLAPGYITTPMPAINGSAALPSTVDVLVNNQRQSSTSVPAGPFALTDVPLVNGAGDLNVVVRDLRGVETVVSQSYYTAAALLAPELSDFSFEAGALRRNFGSESNDYGPVFASGTYRYGLDAQTTVGARAELQRARQAIGADATRLLGTYAVAQGALAVSQSDAGSGAHWLAGIDRVTPGGGASALWEHSTDNYRAFGAGEREARARDRLRIGGGMRLNDTFNAGLSYTRQTSWNADSFSLAGATLGVRLPGNASLSLYASRELVTGGWSAGVNLVVPLEGGKILAANTTRQVDGATTTAVQATQATPAGPGVGWSVRASNAAGQRARAQATLNTNHVQVAAEANAGKDNNAVRLSANGSVGWLEGQAFARAASTRARSPWCRSATSKAWRCRAPTRWWRPPTAAAGRWSRGCCPTRRTSSP